ncbi:MAG: amino acid adenylation domain-containing protein [Oscillospiraceae bacterium]|nr:amino acid adenylation domain-containing protein [Oscillospiraceae bacterium]
MQTNILRYLENTVERVPEKLAFSNGAEGLTFRELSENARAIGSALAAGGFYAEPVVVFMEKHPNAVAAFFGAVYGGCHYVPIDEEMPAHRVELIFSSLRPRAVICDEKTLEAAKAVAGDAALLFYSDIIKTQEDASALLSVRERQLDVDPLYIVFTSGSTGVPKGVCACHRSVIDYIENLSEVLNFGEETVFANQTPLYFDACLKELYPTIKFGATTYLVPKQLFMQPVALVKYLNEYKINTVCWVVSALTVISGLGAFKEIVPEYLHTVAFGSEVFPVKQFNLWRGVLPDAKFVNLYGPTECTGMSCYYEVDREFEASDVIPIGRPFRNTGIMLLDSDNKPAKDGEAGEICIRGTCVTLGYYNDFGRTGEVFVQNPLNTAYPELIYRTGDLAKYNERGELIFISRLDYQIKHMGHRIELGEIELIANMANGVSAACCVFDEVKKKIILYAVGDTEIVPLMEYLREKLPRYMIPNKIRIIEAMPLTPNGKIDRKQLKAL